MPNKLLTFLFMAVLVFSPATSVLAQDKSEANAPAEEKPAMQGRWEGVVIRTSKDNSTLTVRKKGSNEEKTVRYDSSTRWTSQEHGSDKVNEIDASQVKDNDRVIVVGTWDKDGVLHATLISKRLIR
jgi:hypothetical protein